MPRLLLATRNAGKLAELRALLAGHGIDVLGLDAFPQAPEVGETGATFAANALLKARAAAAACGVTALADDSGLCIDSLDGRPGIESARYGGPGLSDEQRVERVLAELASVGVQRSPARFVCAVALVTPGGLERLVESVWEGSVAGPPRGSLGFGYDPIFELPETGLTAAQLPADLKNRLSHRGQAMRRALALLEAEPELLGE